MNIPTKPDLFGELSEIRKRVKNLEGAPNAYRPIITDAQTKADQAAQDATVAQQTAADANTTATAASDTATQAATDAAAANDTATQAQQAATAAAGDASTALTNANDAKTLATGANTTSQTALDTANGAASDAGTALDTANDASTAASNAQSTADAASSAASNAQSTADAAASAASAAQSAADNAKATADSALIAANGKNKITHSISDPSGTGIDGDLWYKHDGTLSGKTIGIWSWISGAWVNVLLDANAVLAVGSLTAASGIIANLDAGVVTTGTLTGIVIQGATIRTAASGARVQFDSGGIKQYDASNAVVSSWTPSGFSLANGSISGSTITGGTFQTAASGPRITISSDNASSVLFWNSTAGWNPGQVLVNQSTGAMTLLPARDGASGVYANCILNPDGTFQIGGGASAGFVSGTATGMTVAADALNIRANTGNVDINAVAGDGHLSQNGSFRVAWGSLGAYTFGTLYLRSIGGSENDGYLLRSGNNIELHADVGAFKLIGNLGATLEVTTPAGSPGIRSATIYGRTTGSGANVNVASDGTLARSTSSLKYKTKVKDRTLAQARRLLDLRPVTYQSLCLDDDKRRRLVGLIAEEVHDAGMTELVSYAAPGEPDGVTYERAVPDLIVLLRHAFDRIDALEAAK